VTVVWQLCDALLLVSEINVETGSPDQLNMAVTDLTRCLELQQKSLPKERRNEIAETYMSLSRAYKMKDEYSTAGEMVEKAVETLREAAENFRTQSEVADATEEVKATATKECERLNALAKDMSSMIDDLRASAEQAAELAEARESEAATSEQTPSIQITSTAAEGTAASVETSAPAPEIAVRKAVKRKSTEPEVTEETPAAEAKDVAEDECSKIKRMKAAVQEGDSAVTNGDGAGDAAAPVLEAATETA
jgi:DNA repair ATPase RecN